MTTRITSENITDATIGIGDIASSVPLNTQWQAVIVGDGSTVTTMVAGRGYFVNTTSAAGILKLPASASRGDYVEIKDYARTFGTNNVTVQRNGHNIDGAATDSTLDTTGQAAKLVYMDATKGWSAINDDATNAYGATFTSATGGTVSTSGNFKIHTFTGDSNFVVSAVGNPAGSGAVVDYLVVAGGGGASLTGGDAAGGGGGGGFRYFASPSCNPQPGPNNPGAPLNAPAGITVTTQTYPITVGGGGAASANSPSGPYGTSGSNSSFSTITSAGGGFGGAPLSPTSQAGQPGGSGGGGGGGGGTNNSGGTGNTPPVSPSQGNNGGASAQSTPDHAAGGGGGAMAVGGAGRVAVPHASGPGGAGAGITGFGSSNGQCSSCVQYFSGGGAGGQSSPVPLAGGSGGIGGGTPAAHAPGGADANTGGGGGAGRNSGSPLAGAAGGKGIVVIRYKFQ